MRSIIPIYISLVILCQFSITLHSQNADYPEQVRKYIDQYKEIAIREMMAYRIPASVTLAQGIHESRAGKSRLATEANNHFGIKCHKDWYGKTYLMNDELPNECFRKYDSPQESFRDHSYFLTQRERYHGLFELDVTDYKGWANGLKAAGYATNPNYHDILIRTIEEYQLYQFDVACFPNGYAEKIQHADVYATWMERFQVVGQGPNRRKVFVNNELRLTIVREQDNLAVISRDFDIPVTRLMKYNDLLYAAQAVKGQIIYLEPKRRKAAASLHQVKEGETMLQISQLYGIKLKMLYKWNDMPEGREPFVKQVLRLR